jgi:hypothetical protein
MLARDKASHRRSGNTHFPQAIMRIFVTHVPDMLENYYGPRALAEMRKLGEVRTNTTGKVLDANALAEAAKCCEIIVSDRQTPGPAEFFSRVAPDCCAFLRVAVDIRNIDVDARERRRASWSSAPRPASWLRSPKWLRHDDRLRARDHRATIQYSHRGGSRAAHGDGNFPGRPPASWATGAIARHSRANVAGRSQ